MSVMESVRTSGAAVGRLGRGRYGAALRTWPCVLGLVIVGLIAVVSIVGPFVIPYGPDDQGPDSLLSPTGQHLLGTDEVGRDLFARLLAGTRVDLLIVLVAVPVAAVVGTLLGLVGMLSRRVGGAVQRVFDVLLGVPGVVLGIAVALALTPGLPSVIVAIVLVIMPVFGRQARSSLLGQLPLDYVTAAEVLGYSRTRVTLRHILPNIVDVLLVRFTVELAHAIMIEGSLSVVGLGIQPPQSSLGAMIKGGSSYLLENPWYALAPVLVVVLLVMGFTLVSGALNRAVLRS